MKVHILSILLLMLNLACVPLPGDSEKNKNDEGQENKASPAAPGSDLPAAPQNQTASFSLRSLSVSAQEGEDFVFVVERTGDLTSDHSVDFRVVFGQGDSADNNDVTVRLGTLYFTNESILSVSISSIEDTDVESNEVFSFEIYNPSQDATVLSTSAKASGTILNDDFPPAPAPPNQAPSINIPNAQSFEVDQSLGLTGLVSISDPDAGMSSVTTTLSLSGSGVINLTTLNGLSVIGNNTASVSLTGAISNTNSALNSMVISSSTVQTMNLNVSVNDLGNSGSGGAQTTSKNLPIQVKAPTNAKFNLASSVSVMEGGSLSFVVHRSANLDRSHSVSYQTILMINDTASANDYTPKTGTLIFAIGETSKTVSVQTTQDNMIENDETLSFKLYSPSLYSEILTSGQMVKGTIQNDDVAPPPAPIAQATFSTSNSSAQEGVALSFTIVRSGVDLMRNDSISYRSILRSGDTASSNDFAIRTGVLNFASGETSKSVSINTVEDSLVESNETFSFELYNPSANALVSATMGRAKGTIQNDDIAPPPASLPSTLIVDDIDGSNGLFISGSYGSGFLGRSVRLAGDFNGDGMSDVILGEIKAQNSTLSEVPGAAYLLLGSASNASLHNKEILNIPSSRVIDLKGNIDAAQTGASVAGIGDINNDGLSDIAIGTPKLTSLSSGEVAVLFGGTSSSSLDQLNLLNLSPTSGMGFRLVTPSAFSSVLEIVNSMGTSVSAAGDFNNDGIADYMVGAPLASPLGSPLSENAHGGAYIIYGKSSGHTNFSPMPAMPPAQGFELIGDQKNDQIGRELAEGDFDGDGINDIVIGAERARNNKGEIYILFGGSDFSGTIRPSELQGVKGAVISGIDVGGQFGISIHRAGDLNNDGIEDLAIVAGRANPRGNEVPTGKVYVLFGQSNRANLHQFDLNSLNGNNGFMLDGGDVNPLVPGISGPRFAEAMSVSNAGDFNGDGKDDLLIGAPGYVHSFSGQAYIIFGKSGSFSSLNGKNLKTDFSSSDGMLIKGPSGTTQGFVHFGESVSSAGDFNNDGRDDIIIGTPNISGAKTLSGGFYIIYGVSGI